MESRKHVRHRLEGEKKNIIMGLADIGGFTNFMHVSRMATNHSQAIINDLIDCIISTIKPPFRINKIEGDAVFFYALESEITPADVRKMSDNLLEIFTNFKTALIRQSMSNFCECQACSNAHTLSIKTVIHSGTAYFYNIANQFEEIGGLDVIIAHRLLKNNVPYRDYLLITDEAMKWFVFDENVKFSDHMEMEPTVGAIDCEVHVIETSEEEKELIEAKKIRDCE